MVGGPRKEEPTSILAESGEVYEAQVNEFKAFY